MSEMNVELTIKIENAEEFRAAIKKFGPEMKDGLYRGFQRIASKEERILKSTGGFRDRTGHLRKSLYVLATYKPLGLEMGALAKYAYWVAEGHGTWKGNFWNTYLREMTPRVVEGVLRVLKRIVNKLNKMFE